MKNEFFSGIKKANFVRLMAGVFVAWSLAAPRAADADFDGLDDALEISVYKTDPTKWDTDGDGQSDGAEVRAGTDPLSAQSYFRIIGNPSLTANGWEVSWSSVSGKRYRLQRADGDQVPASNGIWIGIAEKTASGSITTAADTTATGLTKRFYRVILVEDSANDTTPPVISPILVSNIQTETGGKLRFSVTATDNDLVNSVAFFNAQTQLGLGIPGLNDMWTYDWAPPSGLEGTQTIQATAADRAGNRTSSPTVQISLASKDLFTPLGPDGQPIAGYAVQMGATGTLLPVQYSPDGPSALGGRRSFFLRFPNGAKVVEIGGIKYIEFTDAEAGFGEGFPLQLDEQLKVSGTTARRIPFGPLSFQQLGDLFGPSAQDGISVRLFGKLPLLWKGGTLQDGGMVGAQFALAAASGPLQGSGSSLPDVFIDFTSKEGIRIPLWGEFALPDGSDNAAKLVVPREKPIWLGIRQDGAMYIRGGAELSFPNGGSFKVALNLDDPNYELQIKADGLHFKLLGNLADLLPGSADTCIPGSAAPTADELKVARECLERFDKAYFNFNTALMGASGQGDTDTGALFATPTAALDAWAFRNLASPLSLTAARLSDLNNLYSDSGQSALASPDLAIVVAHRLALVRAQKALDANNNAALTAAIADAAAAALDRARNADSVKSLKALREAIGLLLETERIIQATGQTRLANTSADLAAAMTTLFNNFTRQFLANLGVTSAQSANTGIAGMDRFTAYETLNDLIGLITDTQLLGIEFASDVPLSTALDQLGLRLESLVAGELDAAKIATDYRAYLYSMEDYLELHAWASAGALTSSELAAKLAVRTPQFLVGEMSALALSDETFGSAAVSLRNQSAEVKRLAKILRQVPPNVTFAADSMRRAFDRMETSLGTAMTTLSLYDSQMLADLLQAGTLQEEIREKFAFTTTKWEDSRLALVVDRLHDKGIEEKAWALMHSSAAFLLQKAERLTGQNSVEAKLYIQQALKLILAEQQIAAALWQQESSARTGVGIVDMLLPGDIQVNNVAGALSYNRDTRLLKGSFKGELRMPKFDLTLNIANASFSSGGSFDINVNGGVNLPLQSPPVKFEIPKRHPLVISYRYPSRLDVSAGGKLTLPDGSSVMSYFTIADPLYQFGIEARGLHFNLASNLTVNLPTLPSAGNFTPELIDALNDYYKGLGAAAESLSTLEDIPQIGDVGAVPEFQERSLSVSPDLLTSFAAGVIADVQSGINRDYTSMTNEVRLKLAQLADELREQRDNIHISEILIRGKALQRMCHAISLKRQQNGSVEIQSLWDAPETLEFIAQSEASIRQLLTREDSKALDNIESVMEAVAGFIQGAQCMDHDTLPLMPLIDDFHVRAWAAAHAALFLDPTTGGVANQTEFAKLTPEKINRGLATLLKFNQRSQALGITPNAIERTALQTLAVREREILLTNLRKLSDDPINYYEIGRLTRELLDLWNSEELGFYDYPSTPILQLDGSMLVVERGSPLGLGFLGRMLGLESQLANRIETEGQRALLGLRRDKGKDYFGNTLRDIADQKQKANIVRPPSLTAELNRIFAIQRGEIEAALQSRWTAERLHDAEEILNELVDLAVYAQAMNLPDAPQIGTIISDTLTTKMTVSAETQKTTWLLNRYVNLLLEAANTKVGNDALSIKTALETAASSSIRSADRVVRSFRNLLPTIVPVDIALPGAVRVNRAFGEVTYRRDTQVLGGQFGGRLEFPNHNAYFDLEEGSIDTTGAFHFKAKTSGPLPVGGVRLTASLDAQGGPNTPFAITGVGEVLLGTGEKYSATSAYNGADGSLSFRAAGENLHLLITDHACLFGANLGFKLGGLGQNGQLLRDGELSFGGTVGLLRTDKPPKLTTEPSPEDFHLLVENALAKFEFDPDQFRFVLAGGSLVLPKQFSTALCTQIPAAGQRPPARISIQALKPITAAFKYNPTTIGQLPEIVSLKLTGALDLQNIGVNVPDYEDLAAAVCEGSIVFPGVEITRSGASLTSLPSIQIRDGRFRMPFPSDHPTEVQLSDFVWNFNGFPVGTIALVNDVIFFNNGGFSFTILGGNSCGPDQLATALRVLPAAAGETFPTLEIHGGARLRVAKNVMRKEAGTGDPTKPGQDPEEIQGEACANVVLRPNQLPQFTWERGSIGGTFRLGENGVQIKNARLDLFNLQHIFDRTVNSPNPFTIGISGQILTPNGPGFGVSDTKFVFNNLNPDIPGLPQFQPGTFIYDGSLWTLSQYLPFNVRKATLTFKDGTKQYPDILKPTNVKIVVSASMALPPGDSPLFTGEVGDFEVNFLEDGTPVFSMDSIGISLNTGSSMPPIDDLGGMLYIGGLSDPRNLFVSGKLGGSYNGYKLKVLVAFNLAGPVGMCLDVNAGAVGIPLGVTGILITGASGGISYLNRMNDPCDFTSYVDPVTGKPLSSSAQLPPGLPPFPSSLLTWTEFRQAVERFKQTAETYAPKIQSPIAHSEPSTEPADSSKKTEKKDAPAIAAAASPNGGFDIDCPGDCPPATVNIFCQPHPDQATYPGRVITKFTSIDEKTLNNVFQITLEHIQQLKDSGVNIADTLATEIRSKLETTIPKPSPQLLGADQAAKIQVLYDQTMSMIEQGFKDAFAGALANQTAAETIYQLVKQTAYFGLPCIDMTMQVSGTVSYTGISSFASVTGQGTVSTTGAAGVTGKVNLLGMPVGVGKVFVAATDERGDPNPSVCGDVEVAFGPLELGHVKAALQCEGCVSGMLSVFGQFAGALSQDTLRVLIAKAVPRLANVDLQTFITQTTEVEKLGFLAEMLQLPAESLPPDLVQRIVTALGASWDQFNPEFLFCGQVQPKVFGLGLGSELVEVKGRVHKGGRQAGFSFSPTRLINFILGGTAALFPTFDKATLGYQEVYPDPVKTMLAALSGKLSSTHAIKQYAEEQFSSLLENSTGTISYDLNPMGMRLASAEGRIIMPDLTNHPKFRAGGYVRPELRGLPSRLDILQVALRSGLLGNPLWTGSTNDFKMIYPEGSQERTQFVNLSLTKDFFPYGGIIGAGFVDVPRVIYDAPPQDYYTMLDPTKDTLQRLGAASTWIFDYVLTTTNAGQLGFYIPAPNPPTITHPDGTTYTARETLDAIMNYDFANAQVGELWSISESFLKGYLKGRLLGVPIADADITGVAPGNGGDAYFQIQANMPTNSWMSNFVESASLLFDLRQSPTNKIETAFTTLRNEVEQVRTNAASTQQDYANAIQKVIDATFKALPKTKLEAQLLNFRLPLNLQAFVETPNGANNYYIYGFSPRFEPTYLGDGPVADRRRNGGVAFKGSFLFGNLFRVDDAELGIEPRLPDPITGFTLPPHLTGRFRNISAVLPGNVQFNNVQLDFNSEPAAGEALIDTTGEFPEIHLLPYFEVDAIDRAGTMNARLLIKRGANDAPQTEIKVDPARIYFPYFDPTKAVTIDGGTSTTPFTFSTDPNTDWSGRVTFQDYVSFGVGGATLFRYEGPGISGQLKARGVSNGSITVALNNNATLIVYPGTAQELRFKLNSLDATARFTIAADGTFDIFGKLASDLPLAFGPIDHFSAGAQVELTQNGLTIGGTVIGGVLSQASVASATGQVSISNGITAFNGSISVPPINAGIFHLVNPLGGNLTAQLANDGLSISPAELRVDNLNPYSASYQSLQSDTFKIARDGSFEGGIHSSSGTMNISGFTLATTSLRLKRASSSAPVPYLLTMDTTLQLNDPKLPSIQIAGTIQSDGNLAVTNEVSSTAILGFPVTQMKVKLAKSPGLNGGITIDTLLGNGPFAGTRLVGTALRTSTATFYSLDFVGALQAGGYPLSTGELHLYNNIDGTSGLRAAGSMNVPTIGALDFAGGILSNGRFSISNSLSSRVVNGYTFAAMTNVIENTPTDYRTSVLASGPIGYWRFNEGLGTIARTEISGGLDGTYVNSPSLTVFGALAGNRCLTLNGVNQWANMGADSRYNLQGSFSLECWVKISAFTKSWEGIMTKGDSAWRLHRYSNTRTVAFGSNGIGSGDLAGTAIVDDNQWHHLVAIYDGLARYLYIDGKLDGFAFATGNVAINASNVLIGENEQVTGRYFGGAIDEAAIYNRALTPDEILQHYAGNNGIRLSSTLTLTYPGVTTLKLKGTMNERGAISAQFSPASVSFNGFNFGNANIRYGRLEDGTSSLFFNGGISIAGFITTLNGALASDTSVDLNGSIPNAKVGNIDIGTASMRLSGRLNDQVTLGLNGNVNVPNLALMQFNGSVGVNGAIAMSNIVTATTPFFNFSAARWTNVLRLNATENYASAISADAPIGWWRMEDTGTKIVDSNPGAIQRHGSLLGSAIRTGGALANQSTATYGLQFDGTSGYVSIPNSDTLNFSGAFSIEFWAKIPSFSKGWETIISKGDSGWRVSRYSATSKVSFETTSASGNHSLPSQLDCNDNQWHHYVAIFDGYAKYLYIDGALENWSPYSGPVSANTRSVYIGENQEAPGRYFGGSLDEVALYDKALTPPQVQKHYRTGGRANIESDIQLNLPALGAVTFSGAINNRGSAGFYASANLNLGGFGLQNSFIRFAKPVVGDAFILLDGNLSVPGLPAPRLSGSIVSDGTMDLTMALQPLQIRSFDFSGATLRLTGNSSGAGLLSSSASLSTSWFFMDFNGSISSGGLMNMTNISGLRNIFGYSVTSITNIINQTAYRSAVLASKPNVYWRLADPKGAVAFQEVKTSLNYDGTYYGGIIQGQSGALTLTPDDSVRFDGASAFISIPNESTFDYQNAFSIEAWVKINAFDRAWQTIIAKGDTSWRLSRYGSTSKISFDTSKGGGAHSLVSQRDFNLNEWYHLVAVFDGQTKYLYVNGVLENLAPYPGPIDSNNTLVSIGENLEATQRFWNGWIDEVALYSGALSAGQIAQHYQSAGGRILVTALNQSMPGFETVGYSGAVTPEGAFSLQAKATTQSLCGISFNNNTFDFAKIQGGTAVLNVVANTTIPTGVSTSTPVKMRGTIGGDRHLLISASFPQITLRDFNFLNTTFKVDALIGNNASFGASGSLKAGSLPEIPLYGTISVDRTLNLTGTSDLNLGGFASVSPFNIDMFNSSVHAYGYINVGVGATVFNSKMYYDGYFYTDGSYSLNGTASLRIGGYDTLSATFTLNQNGITGFPTLTYGDFDSHVEVPTSNLKITSGGIDFSAQKVLDTGWVEFGFHTEVYGRVYCTLNIQEADSSGSYNAKISGGAYGWYTWPPPSATYNNPPYFGDIPSNQKIDFGSNWGINNSGDVSVTFGRFFPSWGQNFSWKLW